MVICLEQGVTDFHMIQLLPLLPHHSLLHKNPDWFNLSGAGLPGCPGKQAVKQMSLSVMDLCITIFGTFQYTYSVFSTLLALHHLLMICEKQM